VTACPSDNLDLEGAVPGTEADHLGDAGTPHRFREVDGVDRSNAVGAEDAQQPAREEAAIHPMGHRRALVKVVGVGVLGDLCRNLPLVLDRVWVPGGHRHSMAGRRR
jgi:hypothetical protein